MAMQKTLLYVMVGGVPHVTLVSVGEDIEAARAALAAASQASVAEIKDDGVWHRTERPMDRGQRTGADSGVVPRSLQSRGEVPAGRFGSGKFKKQSQGADAAAIGDEVSNFFAKQTPGKPRFGTGGGLTPLPKPGRGTEEETK